MALPVGAGSLSMGVAMADGLRPYLYADAQEHLRKNLAMYAQGQAYGLDDWSASAGLLFTW